MGVNCLEVARQDVALGLQADNVLLNTVEQDAFYLPEQDCRAVFATFRARADNGVCQWCRSGFGWNRTVAEVMVVRVNLVICQVIVSLLG